MRVGQWFRRARLRLPLMGSVVLGMSFLAANVAAATFTVIDLATLSQGSVAVVRGLNIAGVAGGGGNPAGPGATSGPRVGLVFQSGAVPRRVTGLPGSDDTTIFGLNDNGGFVGASNTATAVRAFASTVAGGLWELPSLAGDNASVAYALNNRGQAVGFSSGAAGERAVMWGVNGAATALPVRAGVFSSRATGINARGDAVGVTGSGTSRRPVIWPVGQPARELGLLSGHVIGEALAINGIGDSVGYSANARGAHRATLWPSAGGVVDIGVLPGGDFSHAFSCNDAAEVVGASGTHGTIRAFLWTRQGGMQDLNSLIPPSPFVLTQAVAINNAGMILATGHDPAPTTATTDAHSHDEAHELPVRVFLLVRAGGVQ
jgi:uncharacterized membrane protein